MFDRSDPTVGEAISGRKKGDVWYAYGSRWEHHGEIGYINDADEWNWYEADV